MPNAIRTPAAPSAIGPYSQAIRSGDLVFTSGQIALRPDGALVKGHVADEVRQVMENLRNVLAAAGCAFADVVKTTIYLVDMEDFTAVNKIYGESFTGAPPARSTVAVSALPKGVRVEIDMIARVPGGER